MNKTAITLLGLSLCAPAFFSQAQEEAPAEAPAPAAAKAPAEPSDAEIKDVISYVMGFEAGSMISQAGPQLGGTVQIDDIDKEVFLKALADALTGGVDPAYESKLRTPDYFQGYSAKLIARNKAQAEANLAKSNAFLAENAKKEGITTTESGLQYKQLTPGEGRKYDEAQDGAAAEFAITYEGRLIDGKVFDKSTEPVDMPVNMVVPGFAEALKLIPIGAEWEVYIPAELAYGEQAPNIIGPNSVLIFKLKVHDIKPKKGNPANPIELTPELLKQMQESGLQPM